MSFLDKVNRLKDQSVKLGKDHWAENKDEYKEKATALKNTVKDKLARK
ncbi:hypothetical protein QWY14_03305 [Planococcus sp. N028]|uniref:Uncharacterized protein n=1 Tax=Planococcus shixiaomingii TaxID=3058393 RepID=A0ABT8MYW2_9BACL|nr:MULTISPECIES: hypothetical protein [unclassified Planococcus (in: firmicutes)]MDN7240798.1 hypothetical protein [Planococcus sp. N028]WKA53047.1 hypothetical protein QWY21_10250 [Planococcus sp. N022]